MFRGAGTEDERGVKVLRTGVGGIARMRWS